MRIGGLQRSLRSDSALAALAFVTVAVVLLAVIFRDA
jgi:hypothetical protein